MVIQFNTSTLLDYLNSLSLYEGQSITLLSPDKQIILQNFNMPIQDLWNLIRASEYSIKENSSFPIDCQNVSYIASMTRSKREGGWDCLSLLPSKSIYSESKNLVWLIIILTIMAFLLSLYIAMVSANYDYKQLEKIIGILNNAGQSDYNFPPMPNRNSDTYGFIIQNLLEMFIEQKYLRIQVSERKYKMQVIELQVLQQQINPHFLLNTLHSIYWETIRITRKPNISSQIISSLFVILEYALSNPEMKVELKQEINYLQSYIDIQKIRYKDKFQVICQIDSSCLNLPIIKLILQPLVENAISHGICKSDHTGMIKIKIVYRANYLYVTIIDNGNGIPPQTLNTLRQSLNTETTETSGSHIGLKNTSRRLISAYGSNSAIKISSKDQQGTIVSFRIPILPL